LSRDATAANSRERQLTGHDLNELFEPRSGGRNDEESHRKLLPPLRGSKKIAAD